MIKKLISCLLFLHVFAGVFGQTDSLPSSDVRINKAYIKSYFSDTRDILIAPIKWKTRQWITTGVVIGATAAMATQDIQIHDFFQKNRSPLSDNVSKYGLEPWGSGVYSLSLLGGTYVYGVLGKNNRAKKIGLLGIKTFVLTRAANYVFKQLVHRHRPDQVEEEVKSGETKVFTQYKFGGPFFKAIHSSFPSGHSVSVFALATIMASEYKEYKWVPVVSYSIAILASLSRLNDNEHWGSDVFMGAAFGWGMAKLIYNHNNWGVKVVPYATPTITGMLITLPIH